MVTTHCNMSDGDIKSQNDSAGISVELNSQLKPTEADHLDAGEIPSILFTDDDFEKDGDHLPFLPPLPPEPHFSSYALTDGSLVESGNDQKQFSIDVLNRCLESCVRPSDGEIDIDRYLDAYREICKLLDTLGAVIRAYIGGDIRQKIALMRKHKAGPHGAHYDTIEKMVAFEMRNRIHQKNVEENGSRTILRLHQSLHFVTEFLRSLNTLGPNQGLGKIGREVYNRTLANSHQWGFKRIARLALSTLGEKKSLIANFHDGGMTPLQLQDVTESVVRFATRVYTQCQAIYERNNCLDLP